MNLLERYPTLARQMPEPARALRLARILIPLCILTGLVTEPLLHWLIPALSAIPLPFAL